MKPKLLLLFTLIYSSLSYGQAPSWVWAKEAYTSNAEFAKDVAVDPLTGDVVVVGNFTGDISAFYGPDFVAASGGGFVAKYNSAGTVLWAFRIGGANDDGCNGVTIDATGNIYVAGFVNGIADFRGMSGGSFVLTSVGGDDAFIAKYNSAGLYQWAKRGGGTGNDQAYSICLNSTSVFITGFYNTTATFGVFSTFSGENNDDIFVVSYNYSGAEQWLADAGATGDGYGYDITANNTDVYVSGDYKNILNIYNSSGVLSATSVAGGNFEGFVINYTNSGNFVWFDQITGGGEAHVNSCVIKGGDLFITGSIDNNTNFPGYVSNPVSSTGSGQNFYVASLNRTTGITQWVKCEPGSNDQVGQQIEVDGNTNVVVTGFFNNDITFAGGPTLISLGNLDVFVVNYTAAGVYNWALQAGGSDIDVPYGIACPPGLTDTYVVGEYKSASTFGTTTLFNQNDQNIFVAKIGCLPISNNTISANQTICSGQTPASLTGSLPTGPASFTYLWQQSPDNATWVSASGTNNLQNYSPPALVSSTYYRRVVSGTGTCSSIINNSSSILITVNQNPTIANAGPDQTSLCGVTSTTLAANTPTVGTGAWSIIIGAGGTVVTPASPSSVFNGVAGAAYVLRWTISNTPCTASTDDVTIFLNQNPTVAAAGPDQTSLCGVTSTTLAANTPTVGTGAWSIISGIGGSFVLASNPTTTFNGIAGTAYVLRWTISNAPCTASTDDVNITFNQNPTSSNAGTDQNVCATFATLAGNTPAIGTGLWTLISGSGTITVPASPTSGITGLGMGANTFRWTISNSPCSPTFDDVVITQDSPPTAAAAGPDQNVCGSSSAFAANTPIVGSGLWTLISGSGSITTPTSPFSAVTGLGVGLNIFRWTISNGACSPSSDDVTINSSLPISPPADAGLDQIICATSTTMTATAPFIGSGIWTLISGTGSITSPTSPTSGITGLGVGANIFRWTVTNGVCTSNDDVTITRSANPTISNAGPDQINLCGITSTTLAANTPTVGTGAWSIISGAGGSFVLASNPTTTFNGVAGTAYVLRWIISNTPCTASTDDVNITFNQNPTTSNAGPDQINLCGVTSTTLAANTPTVGTGAWSIISGAGGSFVLASNPTTTFNGVAGTAYVLRWTISNAPCTASFDNVNITFNQNPTIANAGIDQTSLCGVTSTTLAANTPTVGTGAWSIISGAGGSFVLASNPTTTFNGVAGTAYVLRWTISNAPCTASFDNVNITFNQNPTIANAGIDSTICSLSSSLNGNTPLVGTGLWTVLSGAGIISTPSSPSSPINSLSIGTNIFLWTISNSPCNPSTDTVIYNIDPLPTIANAGFDSTICNSNSTLIGNNPSIGTGLWSIIAGTGTITTPSDSSTSISGLGVGTNTFVWTISNGTCNPSTDTVNIIVDAFPTIANAGFDSTICSSSSILNGNSPLIGAGVWTVITGTGVIASPSDSITSVTGLTVGTNTFVWTISNGTCSSTTDTVNIFVDAFPTLANAGFDSTICASSSILNANSPLIGMGMWTVIAGSGVFATASDSSTAVSGLSVGTNTFVWTISNGTCNPSTDTVNIIVDAFPTIANAGFDSTICASSSVLNGNTPLIGTGLWTVITGSGVIASPTSAISAINSLSIGMNTFVWTISNGTCNSSSDTINIIVDAFPTIANAGFDSTICAYSSILNANTPLIGTGLWTVIAGSGVVALPSNSNSIVSGLSPGLNVFRWTISNLSCTPSFDEVEIWVDEPPTISSTAIDFNTYNSTIVLGGNSPLIGLGNWSVVSGSGTFSNTNDPYSTVSGLNLGTNIFQWTISNGVCPSTSDNISITLLPMVIPNGFSPNGDNLNDYFEIHGLSEFQNVSINVFNRWGNLVYDNSNYLNNWDGKNNNGSDLSDDTYYYTLELNSDQIVKGFVVIKRK